MSDSQAEPSSSGHTVEKIGGTSMSQFEAVRQNIFMNPALAGDVYQRIFVVSAYGGVTNMLLEHKKTGQSGIYSLFADAEDQTSWRKAFKETREYLLELNDNLFADHGESELKKANDFILDRLQDAESVLEDVASLCQHGHFALSDYLQTVREMLASLGEIHSASNTAQLLRLHGINARLVDLSGWNSEKHLSLDEHISRAFEGIDLSKELPIATGYSHCEGGLMAIFDRGYSEMTFSRIAVLTGAREAIIHKEFHLSSADPGIVGETKAVPIGRTNYDVADQLANLGMEAIHPRAAKGLRQSNIHLRVKNTFEPEHGGTLITRDYVSDSPCVEIVAGRQGVYAIELFDQDMVGDLSHYEKQFLAQITRFKAQVINKDLNANTITHYLSANLKTVKRIQAALADLFPGAEINVRKVCIVSAIGSDLKIPGMLARTTQALADAGVDILGVHQCMRQVDMQFVLDEDDYNTAVKAMHSQLVEVYNHGRAIKLA
ncbi:aspartate kinase [Pseudohongiella nitratireducens]|uniref:aspartate kinase n=1 Tax=Pseudohongiella nitratireducens TaxID=1768907 RepID=A0A916VKC7_9GAMM|nr:aspartate kinase [Pseudohongiella nitratireducens]GFZ81319.1 aspartate kinase [Pseudohongiella nitratireducens]|tara:strand:+ start:4490 stop:5962 length:1473 start_codon:yes stop_codon:yes gene_type:complete